MFAWCMWNLEENIGFILLLSNIKSIFLNEPEMVGPWFRCVRWPRTDWWSQCQKETVTTCCSSKWPMRSWALFIFIVSLVCMNSFTTSIYFQQFLKTNYNKYQFVPLFFHFASPNSSTGSLFSSDPHLYHQKYKQFQKLQQKFSNWTPLQVEQCAQQYHARYQTVLSSGGALGAHDQLTSQNWTNPFYILHCSIPYGSIPCFSFYHIRNTTWRHTLNCWPCLSLLLMSLYLNYMGY